MGVGEVRRHALHLLVGRLRRLHAHRLLIVAGLHLPLRLGHLLFDVLDLRLLLGQDLLALDQLLAGARRLLRCRELLLRSVDPLLHLRERGGGVGALRALLLLAEDLPHLEHRSGGDLLSGCGLLDGGLEVRHRHRLHGLRGEGFGRLGERGDVLLARAELVHDLRHERRHLPLHRLLLEVRELLHEAVQPRAMGGELLCDARRDVLHVPLGLSKLRPDEGLRLSRQALGLLHGGLRVGDGLVGHLRWQDLQALQEGHLRLLALGHRLLHRVDLFRRRLQHVLCGQALALALQDGPHLGDVGLVGHSLVPHLRELILHSAVGGLQLAIDAPQGGVHRGLDGPKHLVDGSDLLLGHLPLVGGGTHHLGLLHLQLHGGELLARLQKRLAGGDPGLELLLEGLEGVDLLLRLGQLLLHAGKLSEGRLTRLGRVLPRRLKLHVDLLPGLGDLLLRIVCSRLDLRGRGVEDLGELGRLGHEGRGHGRNGLDGFVRCADELLRRRQGFLQLLAVLLLLRLDCGCVGRGRLVLRDDAAPGNNAATP
mmetsp:Transcript_91936/g.265202  ORF Transcript_91936/g.265202 Transcript_91936/m.265202 type:complete len:539 (+) Transcript_91936:3737-5353(+)